MGDFPGHPFRGNQYTATTSDIVAYHGTAGKNVESILSEGLKSYEEGEPVFVSTDRAEAAKYAGWRDPSGAVVFEVRIPKGTLHRTERAGVDPHGIHLLLKNSVPKEWISGVHPAASPTAVTVSRGDYKTKGRR